MRIMLSAEELQRKRWLMSGRYLAQFAPVDANFDLLHCSLR